MDVSLNRQNASGAGRQGRPPAALGRWTRDARRPSIRLTPPEVAPPPPDVTAPFAIVQPTDVSGFHTAAPPKRTIQLHSITARETMPFMGRTTACPYLECASSNRRCLSAMPAPVSIQRQAKYCMRADHRSCTYYRKARGMAAVPPTQAAFYTAALVTVLLLLFLTGIV